MYKLSIALRYLWRRRIAYISVIAIAFGVMAMIVVSSVMDGFQDSIVESIRSLKGAVRVAPGNPGMAVTEARQEYVAEMIARYSKANGDPVVALSKRLYKPALVSTKALNPLARPGEVRRQFVQLIGVNAEAERKVIPLDAMLDRVQDGPNRNYLYHWKHRMRDADDQRASPFLFHPAQGPAVRSMPGIVLGKQLAERLCVNVGDFVTILSTKGEEARIDSVKDVDTVEDRFIVTGCFQTGRFDFDSKFAFVDGLVLQDLFQLPSDCDELVLRIKSPDRASEVRDELQAYFKEQRENVIVRTWEDDMQHLASALQFEKLGMLIVLACVVAVAGACISGILYMVVLEKTRDVGILLSMGATSRGIIGIFVFYGGFLGALGVALGVFLGLEVVWNLEAIIRGVEQLLNIELFPAEVYEFGTLPATVATSDLVYTALYTFLWCLVASLFPALRAARMDPLKCLVYE